jgi:hypothetical protein
MFSGRSMTVTKIRSIFASLVGRGYKELPGFGTNLRIAIENVLSSLDAKKCGESGIPSFDPAPFIYNEYFQIGSQKIRICTEDEMFVSLWGPKRLVDQVYERIILELKTTKNY